MFNKSLNFKDTKKDRTFCVNSFFMHFLLFNNYRKSKWNFQVVSQIPIYWNTPLLKAPTYTLVS